MNTVKKAPRSLAFAAALGAAVLATMPSVGYAADSESAPVASADGATRIESVSYEAFDGGTRVIIDASSPLVYTSYTPDAGTLVVDVAGPVVRNPGAVESLSVGTSEVVSLSSEYASAESARFAVSMARPVPFRFESLGNRLVIVFEKTAAEALAPVAATPASDAPAMAVAEPERPATTLTAITAEPGSAGVAVTLRGDGSFESYADFALENPSRLILDLKGVTNVSSEESLTVASAGLARVRVAQYQLTPVPVTRVVFDLDQQMAHRVVAGASGLTVLLGETAAAEAAPAPVEEPAPLQEMASEAPVAEPQVSELEVVDLGEDVTLFETADAAPAGEGDANRGEVPISFQAKTIGGGEQQFNGKPLSLDFKDADIKDIFRFISDFSGLNVVLDPTVAGKITIKLTEVPWDQALDIILKNNGLGMVFENNVIRIATTSKLATEEAGRRRLAEEKELAVPLKTITRALSYAKAKDLQKILAKIMTKRGEVIVDARTNTLILSDVPDRFDMITNLIETLDAPTPQVAIEARIVETVRDFAHNLGIQWGFLGLSDAAHGNTTNLLFPNNAIVDGGVVGGQGGIVNNILDGYAVNLPAAQVSSGIGFSFGNVLDTFRLDIALTAFEREGKGRVISAPKVTTQNNVEASIKSGKQIPVTTIANNTVTTVFVDALLNLKVKPQITAEGTVILDITVDKSAPDFANQVLGTPPIDKRQAETSVLVRDGGTTVIGGIFQVTDQQGSNRTPFLHKIPILGNLFKNKAVTRLNNELLIFVTPRIVKY